MTDQRMKHLRVQCMNGECPAPADTVIPIPIIAPGVVQWPQGLRCKECGQSCATWRSALPAASTTIRR